MDIYLVGGAVRDLLCGKTPHDYDWAFDATAEQFVQAYPKARKIIKDKEVYWLDNMEFAQLRGTIDQDMARRDFTMNALSLDEHGVLRGHPDALADLYEKRLRPASATALQDDPVRILRAARLAAQYPELSVEPETLRQMRKNAPLLSGIAAEQAGRETWKALSSPSPSTFLRLLAETGCLSPWFAELENAHTVTAGPPPWHSGSVLEHSCEIMDLTATHTPQEIRPVTVWMALCHDLGKVLTDPDILPHHYGHEKRGEALAKSLGERLRLPTRVIEAGMLASTLHMKAGIYTQLRPGTKVDLLMQAHAKQLVDELFWLAFADVRATQLNADQSGNHLLCAARADLATILAVRLPQSLHNKGELSGIRLREYRCSALSTAHTGRTG